MRFALMVTGAPYGTQRASSALQFARALLEQGHRLDCVFFYGDGVYNGNRFTAPASDEVDVVRGWQQLQAQCQAALYVCVAAALRRGVVDERQARELQLAGANLQPGFQLSGLGDLAQAALRCDRLIQF